jgi:hypothetical protein
MNKEVSFPLAKLLKEKGFDVPVRNYYLQKEKGNYLHEGFEDSYWGDNRIVNWNKDVVGIKPFEGFLSAPTIAEVVMWLHEKYGIWMNVSPVFEFNSGRNDYLTIRGFQYYITVITDNKYNQEKSHAAREYKNSPTEAYEAAIEYTLNNLI